MRHAFIMDPIESVKPWKDTTYYLMLAAADRGHEVYTLSQMDLSLRHDYLVGKTRQVEVTDDHNRPFAASPPKVVNMDTMDCVWVRTDPPLNRRYLYTTLLLDFLSERVCVINRPQAIRDWNEKLAALKFPELTPATLVSGSVSEIEDFMARHGRITVKPIDGHGGKGVEFCSPGDDGNNDVFRRVTANGARWIIAQKYLEDAKNGDKRILLLDGTPIGAILRLHAEGRELNNLDAGGTANPAELSPRDLEICRQIGPSLRRMGIVFAGIDIIGGQMIEVNVTSPTGLQEASRFSGLRLHHKIIESLEQKSITA